MTCTDQELALGARLGYRDTVFHESCMGTVHNMIGQHICTAEFVSTKECGLGSKEKVSITVALSSAVYIGDI